MALVFRNMSISNKLATVFLLLLVMMGIGGVVALYNAGQLAKVAERLYLNSFKRAETLSSIENEFLSSRQEMFLHTITTDQSSRTYLEISVLEHKQKIAKLLYEYKTLGIASEHIEIYRKLNINLAGYWHIHHKVEALSKAGHRDSALSIIRLEGNKSFSDTIDALRTLIKEEREIAYNAYQQSDFFSKVIIAVTFIFTLMAILVAGAMWMVLIRSIVKPIIALEESAKLIGSGDFNERAPVMTEDEIGSLATEFNKMADNIEDSYATLEGKVKERTDELRLANEELSGKKQELEVTNLNLQEANKMKSQFLSNVSHELRTPLNSIIGFSELLQEKTFGDLNERQTQYAEFVHSSGEHLLSLINNILDLSRIETGRMLLQTEKFPMLEVIAEVMGLLRPSAHERNMVIETKSVPASPMLNADKSKFKQIMTNLLSNAVKFNVEGGRVKVEWDIVTEPVGVDLERYIIFCVKDTGIGIKEEDRQKVFKEFEQIDSSMATEVAGTGLGLVLTKRLVELHGGSIWFESTEGKGSAFYVKLPQGTDEVDLPVINEIDERLLDEEDLPVLLMASESDDINRLLEIYLTGCPYNIIVASDGLDLLRKVQEQKVSVIITGITIPKKDGWEVIRELKSAPETMHIPVVIISSIYKKEMGESLGAAEYLQKPINKDKLIRVLARLMPPPLLADGSEGGLSSVLLFGTEGEYLAPLATELEAGGLEVHTAINAEELNSTVEAKDPDLVVACLKRERTSAIESICKLTSNGLGVERSFLVCTPDTLSVEENAALGPNVQTVMLSDGQSVSETVVEEIRKHYGGS
ncbi:MAG: MCP four helix bundle domain-containing protein [Proteobacteria bacterium]|nr:MCP four helix bundle domain-containing protein [Pseudomonadota bacterium]